MIAESRRSPRVFVSYAPDSDQHEQQVRNFARFLRSDGGIDVQFSQWDADRRRDWSVWVIDQLRTADFVLAVASPTYKRCAEGDLSILDTGTTQFEVSLLRDMLTGDRDRWLSKVLPVVLPGRSVEDIPTFFLPHAGGHYLVDSLTVDGADELLRTITGQQRHLPPPRGTLIALPTTILPATNAEPHRGSLVSVNSIAYEVAEVHDEKFASDLSWVRRSFSAKRTSPPWNSVVLRQCGVLRNTESADRQRAALVREAALLTQLDNVAGFPRLLDQLSDQDGAVVVLNAPAAHSLRDLYGFPRDSPATTRGLEQTRVVGFLRSVYRICPTLQALHDRGLSHRALTPDAVLLVDGHRIPMLRDMGLTTIAPSPGEGGPPYQAPEQQHPRRSSAPGARTDVFQLALIVHHVLTGRDPASALSSQAGDPQVPPRLTRLLTESLSPVVAHRPPDAAAFAKRLAGTVDQLRLR